MQVHFILKKIYYAHPILQTIGSPFKALYFFFLFHCLPTKVLINLQFKRAHGYPLNFKKVGTLNEKIQWMKIHVRDPLYAICADKYQARSYVSKTIGDSYLIELLHYTDNPHSINQACLPEEPVIIKASHDSGSYFIVRDKLTINWLEKYKEMQKWLNRNYYTKTKEWPYKNLKPGIVIEKLLLNKNGTLPNDYKFHCFHGEPKIIYVTSDREGDSKRDIYDCDWNHLPVVWASKAKRTQYGDSINSTQQKEKPQNLDAMLEIARKLSAPFVYVRVDLYSIENRIYFGELTFYQGGGFDIITPFKWDQQMGSWVDLSKIDPSKIKQVA